MATGYIDLTLKFFQDGERWVGVCLELSTATDGDTLDEVRDHLNRAVQDLLDVCAEQGDLEEFLFQRGVVPQPAPVDMKAIRLEQVQVSVGTGSPAKAETQAVG